MPNGRSIHLRDPERSVGAHVMNGPEASTTVNFSFSYLISISS
jgi:hypothetical protein